MKKMARFNRDAIEFMEKSTGVSRQRLVEAMPEDIKQLVGSMSATQAIRYARENFNYGLMEATVFAAALSADKLSLIKDEPDDSNKNNSDDSDDNDSDPTVGETILA